MSDNRRCYCCLSPRISIYDERIEEYFCDENCHFDYLITRNADKMYEKWSDSYRQELD